MIQGSTIVYVPPIWRILLHRINMANSKNNKPILVKGTGIYDGSGLLSTDKLKVDIFGNVKLIKNWAKIILDGSENWTINTSGTPFYQLVFTGHITGNAYSNYFTYNNVGATTDNIAIFLTANSLRIRNGISTTLEQFKTWLSEHNTEVYYQLATPQEIDLGESTLKTIEGTNNVILSSKI